ncbi:hypothetical protein Tco_0937976 [Tanacetum coccineum]|uniref:Uncharacterized protein n=1 Tax=Tanacetum coccineum TaxID=301880 RepID=A0ABQ5DFT2_9ASTR
MGGDDYEGAPVFDDGYEEAPIFDDDQFEEESMPVYDTDIEDVIEEEEGFVGKGGFGVDFSKTIDSNPHELIWSQKGNLVDVSILIGKKYQEGYLKAKPMDDKLGFKTIKVRGRVIIKKGNLMQGIQIWMLQVQGTSEANSRTSFQVGENDAIMPSSYVVFRGFVVFVVSYWYQEPKFLIKIPLRRTRNINDVYERIMATMEERLDQFVDQFVNRMNDMMNLGRCRDRYYGVAGDDYEGALVFDDNIEEAPVFDDDQFEEESMPVYDTDIEDVIEEEEGFVGKGGFGNLVDVSILIGKKYQEGYLKAKPMDDKLGFKTIKVCYERRRTYTFTVLSQVMSTLAHIDSETISQTDGARSSRVPVPLPDNPYMAVSETKIPQPLPFAPSPVPPSDDPYLIIRHAHIPATIDTKSEPVEAPSETEEFETFEPSDTRITSSYSTAPSDSTTPLSPDHPLAQTSPALT